MANSHDSTEPVAWVDERAIAWLKDHPRRKITTTLEAKESYERPMAIYTAAPVAQQPQCRDLSDADMDKIATWIGDQERGDIGFQGLCDRIIRAFSTPVAQQQQYDQTALELCAVCGWKTLIPGDCCLICERNKAQQPQAEAVQYTRADLDRAYSAGLVEGERLAIQQAEAVPPGYVLVPVEPTDEMLAPSYMGKTGPTWPVRKEIYRAMVAAAIAQQKGQP